jgi:S1-C subfamily serine protease
VNLRPRPAVALIVALWLLAVGAFCVDYQIHRPPPALTVAQLLDLEQAATVYVGTPDGGAGSGVLMHSRTHGKTYLWTAGHVAEGYSPEAVFKIRQVRKQGSCVIATLHANARVLRVYPKQDVALLEVLNPSVLFKTVAFRHDDPPVGETVVHIGYFGGMNFPGLVARGHIAAKSCIPDMMMWPWEVRLDVVQFPAMGGASGGPVFDQSGKVVGLLVGTTSAGMSVIVPTRDILKIATEHRLLDAMP